MKKKREIFVLFSLNFLLSLFVLYLSTQNKYERDIYFKLFGSFDLVMKEKNFVKVCIF